MLANPVSFGEMVNDSDPSLSCDRAHPGGDGTSATESDTAVEGPPPNTGVDAVLGVGESVPVDRGVDTVVGNDVDDAAGFVALVCAAPVVAPSGATTGGVAT